MLYMAEEQKNETGNNAQAQQDERRGSSTRHQARQEQQAQAAQKPAGEKRFEGYMSEIVDIAPVRTGIYGEIKQAMCKILEGKDKGRVIRRNIAGRMQIGDIMRLPDTSREDKPIRSR